MDMLENQPLAPFTTFGIGGPARWFVEAASEDEIAEAATWAEKRRAELFVLGGGSNLLVSDRGFDGLVLHVGLRGTETEEDSRQRIYRVAAGEDWDGFVERVVEENCAGVECLAGIPGTVGGTPVQNVGAYGQDVASAIELVRAFDLEQHAFVEFTAAECAFEYRRSRFNSIDRGRYIVTRVDYRLTPGGAPTLRYADLQRAIQEGREDGAEPGLTDVAAGVRRVRLSKGMLLVEGDADCRSAGSFFKNPVVTKERVQEIAQTSAKQPPRFPAGQGQVKLPAAWLIEQSGFPKGFALGAAGISSRHTLALINRGGATAEEIIALASEIAAAVEAQFGISLDMEPVMVGF
ncbi:MAG TPA: UDP-N-acetylmuramate dehydrogenase [Terracidiphilus sp.]|nr:UDP-N-acetylmuramate dehydrogenase [Terracidiphilus sp.]